MDIEFIEPAEDDVVRIYEDYRMCNEPDSPAVPFALLKKVPGDFLHRGR